MTNPLLNATYDSPSSCFLAIFLAGVHPLLAQSDVDGTTQFVNLGVGFHGPGYHSGWRPAYLGSIETGIAPNLTVGITGSYFDRSLSEPYAFRSFSVGIRASYYLNALLRRRHKKMNYYAGAGVSYYGFRYAGLASHQGYIYVPVHVGARRLIGKRYGLFSELGFNDTGFIKVGLSRKF